MERIILCCMWRQYDSYVTLYLFILGTETTSVWLTPTSRFVFKANYSLTCHISEDLPLPSPVTFHWYRDHQNILNSDRYDFRQINNSAGNLIIIDFDDDLSGDYRCALPAASYRLISPILTLEAISKLIQDTIKIALRHTYTGNRKWKYMY